MLRIEDCQPGVMVECVRSEGTPLVAKATYTIRNVLTFRRRNGHVETGVRLHGAVCPRPHPNGEEGDFALTRFRLLPDSRLAVFRAMLAPLPAEREAELLRVIEGVAP